MLTHLLLVLAQATTAPASLPQAKAPASPTATAGDSTEGERRRARREKKPPRRAELTPDHLATAFADGAARSILLVARVARQHQDSSLQSYDATTYQRISAGFGLAKLGRDRLAFRTENATHVRWRRGVGAYVDVTGSRSVMPIAGSSARIDLGSSISPIPYYPGSETLWIGASMAKQDVDENEGMVHPLATGAEAYYTYESGDSVSFRLPDGKTILLRELRVRPRQPKWNLAVGSLWFDMSGGQLVRAAYRMAVPMDIGTVAQEDDSSAFEDVPAVMKPLMFPMTAQVSAIGVEYGLFQGRFWLPRLQVLEGGARVGVMRVPFKLEQRYEYADVNSGAPLPPIPPPTDSSRRVGQDVSVSIGTGMDGPHSARDSARARRRPTAACDSTGNRSYTRRSRDSVNLVFVRIPCDSAKLANSPDLPPSIYDTGDEVFSSGEMDALVAEALSMGAQAEFAPQPLQAGLDGVRYNRIEGLSLGVRADQVLGAGYVASGSARIGLADRQPNVELSGSRSDLRRTLTVTAYNRLVSANDWGNPFSLGRSLNAFVFARDEGYYYRASGLELTSTPDEGAGSTWSWGVFAEQQRTARVRTNFSLARAAFGIGFDTNLVARREGAIGARTRLSLSHGEDPQGLRSFGEIRLEGAEARESGAYGRGAAELTTSHGIGNGAAALTIAGGSSLGNLPAQRHWYLGGSQTVRGQRPGIADGNAFWLARAEAAHGVGVVRPVVFADIGWAGDRTRWRDIGRPLSGAGVGVTVMDGLLRFDVAKGINPEKRWRVETYLEARF
jgi:hypothetical protein